MGPRAHSFHAIAFVENLSLKEVAPAYPEGRRTAHDLAYAPAGGGDVFIYPFGAMAFHDVPPANREAEIARLRRARPGLTTAQVFNEELTAREEPGARIDVVNGVLTADQITIERGSVIAMTMAQSAAMEYFERIVDQMFAATDKLGEKLERDGTVAWSTRPLHRFIGQAIGTRSEVLSTLHLLDKPDAVWDDPGADRIFEVLRAELDLADRYHALELKLRSVQEALELVLDVARDRRLVLLEASIVFLIVLEIALTVFGRF